MHIFGVVEPKLNILPLFCTLFFKEWYLSSPLAPLQWKIDICAHRRFCTKFNFEPLLFETFFEVMRIFDGV